MKLLFFALVIIPFISFSQEENTCFKTVDGFVIWQKVYNTELSFDQLISKIKDSGFYDKYDIEDGKIQGELKPFDINYKAAGGNYMTTSIYISRNQFSGFVLIEYQPGKYRVTFKRIVLTQTTDDPFSRKGDKETLDFFIAKKGTGEIKKAFFNKDAGIIEYTFNNIFSIKDKSPDNW